MSGKPGCELGLHQRTAQFCPGDGNELRVHPGQSIRDMSGRRISIIFRGGNGDPMRPPWTDARTHTVVRMEAKGKGAVLPGRGR